jgi:hypothetical protein
MLATTWLIVTALDGSEYEGFGGMRIGSEAVVLVGNMPQCHFAHHKSHMT